MVFITELGPIATNLNALNKYLGPGRFLHAIRGGLIYPQLSYDTPSASSPDNPLIPHRGMLNVTHGHVDAEIIAVQPIVVATPPDDAVWSVDFRENH